MRAGSAGLEMKSTAPSARSRIATGSCAAEGQAARPRALRVNVGALRKCLIMPWMIGAASLFTSPMSSAIRSGGVRSAKAHRLAGGAGGLHVAADP